MKKTVHSHNPNPELNALRAENSAYLQRVKRMMKGTSSLRTETEVDNFAEQIILESLEGQIKNAFLFESELSQCYPEMTQVIKDLYECQRMLSKEIMTWVKRYFEMLHKVDRIKTIVHN